MDRCLAGRSGQLPRRHPGARLAGLFLSGATVLDWSANGREWKRFGNRSPYKRAAPHGIYRCAGDDRWIAISCFTDDQWRSLATAAGSPRWLDDPRFVDFDRRLAHQDELDALVESWTREHDSYDVMDALQRGDVPAGVCQNAQDRCERDPQLAHLNWLTELDATHLGRWPVAELPIKLSDTPAHVGGLPHRGAPLYGEDNRAILTELLGMSDDEVDTLTEDGVL